MLETEALADSYLEDSSPRHRRLGITIIDSPNTSIVLFEEEASKKQPAIHLPPCE